MNVSLLYNDISVNEKLTCKRGGKDRLREGYQHLDGQERDRHRSEKRKGSGQKDEAGCIHDLRNNRKW